MDSVLPVFRDFETFCRKHGLRCFIFQTTAFVNNFQHHARIQALVACAFSVWMEKIRPPSLPPSLLQLYLEQDSHIQQFNHPSGLAPSSLPNVPLPLKPVEIHYAPLIFAFIKDRLQRMEGIKQTIFPPTQDPLLSPLSSLSSFLSLLKDTWQPKWSFGNRWRSDGISFIHFYCKGNINASLKRFIGSICRKQPSQTWLVNM